MLKAEWAGPGIKREEIPASVLFHAGARPMVPLETEDYAVDRRKPIGGQIFAAVGCIVPSMPDVKSVRAATPLADLDLDSRTGCLGTHVGRGIPNYELNDDQRSAIKAAPADKASLKLPLAANEQVVHTMAAFNCYACHKRGDVGGPMADRRELHDDLGLRHGR